MCRTTEPESESESETEPVCRTTESESETESEIEIGTVLLSRVPRRACPAVLPRRHDYPYPPSSTPLFRNAPITNLHITFPPDNHAILVPWGGSASTFSASQGATVSSRSARMS